MALLVGPTVYGGAASAADLADPLDDNGIHQNLVAPLHTDGEDAGPSFFLDVGALALPMNVDAPAHVRVRIVADEPLQDVTLHVSAPAQVLASLPRLSALGPIDVNEPHDRLATLTPLSIADHQVLFVAVATGDHGISVQRAQLELPMLSATYPREVDVTLPDPKAVPSVFVAASHPTADYSLPIMFLPGYDPSGLNDNCVGSAGRLTTFDDVIGGLRAAGWPSTPSLYVRWGFYTEDPHTKDTNGYVEDHVSNYQPLHQAHYEDDHATCLPAVNEHGRDVSIRHLAWHWAWGVYESHRTSTLPDAKMSCVNALGYSMGGLIIRYALFAYERKDPDFPPDLCIKRVVTFGTPHGGANFACCSLQAKEQIPSSTFLDQIGVDGDPVGRGGTSWTIMGSADDWVAGYDGTTNMPGVDHKVLYTSKITHSDTVSWVDNMPDDHTATVAYNGREIRAAPWAWRWAANSLAHDDWGCGRFAPYGTPASMSWWPLDAGEKLTGVPYSAGMDCIFAYEHTPVGGRQFRVWLETPPGVDRDLLVTQDDYFRSFVCSSTGTASSKECTLPGANAGNYQILVEENGNSIAPFSVRVVAVPMAPSSFTATPGLGKVTLSWGAPTDDGGDLPMQYKLYRNGVLIATVATGNPLTYTDSFLSSAQTYSYSVVAINDAGQGFSATASATPLGPPGAPTASATGITGGVRVSWTEPTSDGGSTILGYKVKRCATSGCDPSSVVYNAGSTVRSWDDTSAISLGTTYFYQVSATNSYGEGLESTKISASPTPQNDCGSGRDGSDSITGAYALGGSTSCSGEFPHTDDNEDWYAFNMSHGEKVNIVVDPTSDFNIYLYTPYWPYEVKSSTNTGETAETIKAHAKLSGEWKLRVHRYSGTGTYTMQVTVNARPVMQSLTCSPNPSDAGGDVSCSFQATDTNSGVYYFVTWGDGSPTERVPATGTVMPGVTQSAGPHKFDSDGSFRVNVTAVDNGDPPAISIPMSTTQSVNAAVQNDCGSGGDAGNRFDVAYLVARSTSCSGALPTTSDGEDWYKFSMSNGETVDIVVDPTSDFVIFLFRPSNSTSWVSSSRNGGEPADTITYTATENGEWRLRVYRYSGTGTYTMQITVTTSSQDDCGSGTDAGGSFSTAYAVGASTSCNGAFPTTNDGEDWYKFPVNAVGQIDITVAHAAEDRFDIYLYSPSSSSSAVTSATGSSASKSISYSATETGDWRLRIVRYSGTGDYTTQIAVSTSQNDCDSGTDAGGSFSTAYAVGASTSCNGAFPTTNDGEDWYKFPVNAVGQIDITVAHAAEDRFDIYLYRPSSSSAAVTSLTGWSASKSISYSATETGDWRLRIVRYSGTGDYSMQIAVSVNQNDCGSGGDAGNSHSTATSISQGASCSGSFPSSTDSYDWYKVSLNAGQTIWVIMDPDGTSNFDLALYTSGGTLTVDSVSSGGTRERVATTAASAGVYHIKVSRVSGTGTYSLITTAATGDCGTGGDAAGSFSTASGVTPQIVDCQGSFPSTSDSEDWYMFPVSSGAQIDIYINMPSTSNFDIYLYRPSSSSTSVTSVTGWSASKQISYSATETGDWRLRIVRNSGTGAYTLDIETD